MTAAVLCLLGFVGDFVRHGRIDYDFWGTASILAGLDVFAISRRTSITVWGDFVEVVDWGTAVVIDRAQQSLPFWDHRNGKVQLGSGDSELTLASGLNPEEMARVEQGFRSAHGSRPRPYRLREIEEHWVFMIAFVVALLPAAAFRIFFEPPDASLLPLMLGLCVVSQIAAHVWVQTHPRLKDLYEQSV